MLCSPPPVAASQQEKNIQRVICIVSACHLSNGCLTPAVLPVVISYQQSGTTVLTMQGISDQSHCQLKPSGMGEGDMAIQPIGINNKAANLAILSYKVDLHTT